MAFLTPAAVSTSLNSGRSLKQHSPLHRSLRMPRTTPRAALPTLLGDRILVRPDKPLEKTAAGLLLSTTEDQRPQSGTVAAVGTGRRRDDGTVENMNVKVGDRVFWIGYAREITCEGEDMTMVKGEDCCGKI